MNSGFAHFNAAYLVGVNVGIVSGSIIFSLRSNLLTHYYKIRYIKEETTEKFSFLKFVFRPMVLATLFMALMPYVVSLSFMEYFLPFFGADSGLREANIGQLMLLNGLMAILFGTRLCEFVSKNISVRVSTIFPLLLDAGLLYMFSLSVSLSMLILTIVLLSIVHIFALTNIQTFYSFLYQSSTVSSIKALTAFSIVENMSSAIGPIVFSFILSNDIAFGMKMFAIQLPYARFYSRLLKQ